MPKRSSKDLNQTAAATVAQATMESQSQDQTGVQTSAVQTSVPVKNPAAVALGRLGGLKGGAARAKALTKKQRTAIAKSAALSRWKRVPKSK